VGKALVEKGGVTMTVSPVRIELVGMMDSPFVRRVAIAMVNYRLPYANLPLSVYTNPEKLAVINPMLTVPVLIVEEQKLLDSKLILQWLDSQAMQPLPTASADWLQAAAVGDLTAAKIGEYYREVGLRDMSLHCVTAIERLRRQVNAGLAWLEGQSLFSSSHQISIESNLDHCTIAIATSYQFVRSVANALEIDLVGTRQLDLWCRTIEATSCFLACPPS
jgi:Glutathione S-transferase, N-terminal domain